MGRKPRIIDSAGYYHIIHRGNEKRVIFHDEDDYRKYLTLLSEAKGLFGFSLFHYVLMPNHIHLLLRPNNNHLSRAMHAIHMNYSRYRKKRYKTVGHIWQGPFKSLHINSDAYMLSCGNYIELNPVRAKLVKYPKVWKYSSYHFYAFGKKNPLLEESPIYTSLGLTSNEREVTYRKVISLTRSF